MPEFPCPGPVTVDVRLAGGNLELHAESRDTATVEVSPYDDSAASREAAEQARVELAGDTLTISAPEPGGWAIRWRHARLRVSARVPTGSTGRVKTASADVSCRGEWARVDLTTASGDVDVEQVTGDLAVNTASGDLRIGQVGGEFTVKTASGDVTARRTTGAVEVKSASGDVQLDETGADVSVKTASGDTRIGAARRGSLRTTTVSGDVSIGVVSGTRLWLDLNSLSGQTRSDLTMDGEGEAGPPSHELAIQARAVSGSINVHRVTLPTAA